MTPEANKPGAGAALHPSARAFLEAMRHAPQPDQVSLEEFRDATGARVPQRACVQLGEVIDETIPGGSGQALPIRIYRPAGSGPFPAMVWMHAGSFVKGSLETSDPSCRELAHMSECLIISVDYRLAPESPFPKPLHDCYAALSWACGHCARFGGDSRALGVGGQSSGGNLAAATALLAKQKGGPAVQFQVLFEPVLDASCGSDSCHELAEGYILTRRQMLWMYAQYAPGISPYDPLLSPLHSEDLSGLPAAVVVTVEFDPARDEGQRYARRLAESKVPVRHACLPGMLHHFPGEEAITTVSSLLDDLLSAQRLRPTNHAQEAN